MLEATLDSVAELLICERLARLLHVAVRLRLMVGRAISRLARQHILRLRLAPVLVSKVAARICRCYILRSLWRLKLDELFPLSLIRVHEPTVLSVALHAESTFLCASLRLTLIGNLTNLAVGLRELRRVWLHSRLLPLCLSWHCSWNLSWLLGSNHAGRLHHVRSSNGTVRIAALVRFVRPFARSFGEEGTRRVFVWWRAAVATASSMRISSATTLVAASSSTMTARSAASERAAASAILTLTPRCSRLLLLETLSHAASKATWLLLKWLHSFSRLI